jgi:hypothetical protein
VSVPRPFGFLVAVLLLAPLPARAQSSAAVSFGLSFTEKQTVNGEVDNDSGPGVQLRLRSRSGLGPTIGFNWLSSAARTTIGGQPAPLGRVSVRPLMGGVAYTWRRDRAISPVVSLQGGYAFTSIRATGDAKRAYAARLGARDVGLHTSNALAWCASASLWVDLGPRFGLLTSVGYLGVRPSVITRSSLGTTRERIDMSAVVTTVSLVYSVF